MWKVPKELLVGCGTLIVIGIGSGYTAMVNHRDATIPHPEAAQAHEQQLQPHPAAITPMALEMEKMRGSIKSLEVTITAGQLADTQDKVTIAVALRDIIEMLEEQGL